MKKSLILALAAACMLPAFAAPAAAPTPTMFETKGLTATKELKVLKAYYGVKGKCIDVTKKVQELAAAKKDIAATNSLAGKDPANGIGKKLEVLYSVNGQLKLKTVNEWGTLKIADLK